MQNNTLHTVSEQALDNLLKQAFLNLDINDPKNETLMEAISDQTFSQPAGIITGAGKPIFSAKLIAGIIGLSLVSLLIILYYPFTETKRSSLKQNIHAIETSGKPVTREQKNMPAIPERITPLKTVETPAINSVHNNQPAFTNPGNNLPNPSNTTIPVNYQSEKDVNPEDTSYVFPVLTADEIKQNEKRKQKMVDQAMKFSKEKYVTIPQSNHSSIYWYEKGTLLDLHMQTVEVTNLEYKTFLFDLLIHNDKQAFLKAKPNQTLWNTIYNAELGKYFTQNYFSDKKYNDFPVVNINRAGAELYCKWLENESKKIAQEKDIPFSRNYRLPNNMEWSYAAEFGTKRGSYPWGADSIQNTRGCFLANICIQKMKNKLNPVIDCKNKNTDTYTSSGLYLGDESLTAKVYSYNLSYSGLYCMSGNVAEFATDHKTNRLVLKGGSWNGSLEDAKIASTEIPANDGASPYNGFRIAIEMNYEGMAFVHLDPNDPKLVFPKLTKPEIKENEAQKEKMIKQLVTFSKDKYAYVNMGSCLYEGQLVSTRAFYMQTTEVSNKEYKTFLLDLLIHGKKEAFVKNLPDQKQWTQKIEGAFLQPMEDLYFSHPAYDNYPVINITKDNAKAYCDWLTIEANAYLTAHKKPLINDLRIPADHEWAMAANNKTNHVTYANGTNNLRNSKGNYIQNYECVAYDDSKRDTIHDIYLYKPKKEEAAKPDVDGELFTTLVNAYAPNLYGIYNMAGNVSEMVYIWNTKTNKAEGFGTKGGSWCSPDYFLEIDAKQEFKRPEKPSPLIGFRPVMTALVKK